MNLIEIGGASAQEFHFLVGSPHLATNWRLVVLDDRKHPTAKSVLQILNEL